MCAPRLALHSIHHFTHAATPHLHTPEHAHPALQRREHLPLHARPHALHGLPQALHVDVLTDSAPCVALGRREYGCEQAGGQAGGKAEGAVLSKRQRGRPSSTQGRHGTRISPPAYQQNVATQLLTAAYLCYELVLLRLAVKHHIPCAGQWPLHDLLQVCELACAHAARTSMHQWQDCMQGWGQRPWLMQGSFQLCALACACTLSSEAEGHNTLQQSHPMQQTAGLLLPAQL